MSNQTSILLSLIIGIIVVFSLGFVLKSGSDNKSSSPTSRPTLRPNGPTLGPNGPTLGPNGPTLGPNGPNSQQRMLFYNSSTGRQLSDDNACYSCKDKVNVCGCYANNNCSVSPDKFQIPPVCGSMPCMQYETQDENGGSSVYNQNGISLYKGVVNDPYLCNSSNPQTTCRDQCEQHDYPFNKLPFCSSCCKAACALQNCPTGGGGTPIRTFAPIPSGNVPACAECETICRLNSPYGISCEDCNRTCSNK